MKDKIIQLLQSTKEVEVEEVADMLCKLVADELDDKLETHLFYTLKTVKRKLGVLKED